MLKRSITLSELTEDFNIFYITTSKARDLYPGNEDIQAYYVMSLLKLKKYDEAYEVAENNLISSEFKPLLAQAILFKDNNNPESFTIVEYIETRKDPSFFEYLATLLDSRSLFVNSALLWAKSGEIEKSFNIIDNIDNNGLEELSSLLAYDSGRQSEALLRLLELPTSDAIKYNNLLLIADLFYFKENYSRSRYYYEEAIKLDVPNATPYMNITSIYLKGDNIKQAISFLNSSVNLFNLKISTKINIINELKNDLEVLADIEEIDLNRRHLLQSEKELKELKYEYKELVLLLFHLYKEINSDNAVKTIEDYRKLFPQDVKVELLYMRENNSKINPELFIAKLWKLLNLDLENREVSEFMVWYLLGTENYDDINLILERSDNRYPENSWTKYYRAIISGLQSDYVESINYFNTYNLDVESWELLYNKGVIEMALLNYSEALTLFNKSIISLNQMSYLNNRDEYLSQIKTKIAQVLINLNDTDEAIRILNSAFELDPNNYTSDLLKSIYIDLKESE